MPEATNVIVAAQGNVVIRMLSPIGSGEGGEFFCCARTVTFHWMANPPAANEPREPAPKLAGVVVCARNFFGRNQLCKQL
jgi:hypothetical protein